ncbi:hypothetical protein BWQ96_02380 [Gracilariopsis chorda]|uniref:Uncharacterized protein n=1 Tax=Gracilariopsis chorda TaxID=448386 RepID=A0A2V3J0B6_9FLOR|nr:hypothetical protein BWQ96_02380 [Gracilariopsis chorda]|eukprot:PXF47844.1 hypothetical protein BWQ96_02380 [Gracilariopsis chorda]
MVRAEVSLLSCSFANPGGDALLSLLSDCRTNTQSAAIDVLIYNAAVVERNERNTEAILRPR